MKNKQIPFLYGISTVQLIGIIGLSVNTMAGTAVVAVGTVGILVYATANLFQRLKEKVCPECGTRIPKSDRICAVCGYRYREGIPEEKLTEFIEKEKEKEMCRRIHSLMKKAGWSLEQTMEMMDIPEERRETLRRQMAISM